MLWLKVVIKVKQLNHVKNVYAILYAAPTHPKKLHK